MGEFSKLWETQLTPTRLIVQGDIIAAGLVL